MPKKVRTELSVPASVINVDHLSTLVSFFAE